MGIREVVVLTPDNVFIVTLSDAEIHTVRRAAILLGKTVTNVIHDFIMEEAERTIEDAEMLQEMAHRDMQRTAKAYDDEDRSEKDAMWERYIM